MELKDYPFIKCLHPKRIYSSALGRHVTVPCGTCRSCQMNKSARYKLQVQLESLSNKYTVFSTLTYSNSFIPRMNFGVDVDQFVGKPFYRGLYDVETGEVFDEGFEMLPADISALRNKTYLFGDIPYLRKSDVQLYLKRLRKNLSAFTDERIRYYIVGEYGPEKFRPHYHCLLFFNSKVFTEDSGHVLGEFPRWTWFDSDEYIPQASDKLSVLEYCIRKSWRFGRCDAQYTKKDASQYVAGYLNGFSNLPRLYQISSTRPFCIHSQFLGQGVLKVEATKIYQYDATTIIKRGVNLNGEYKEFELWRSAYSAYFPKCKGFVGKSSSERLYSYKLWSTACSLFPWSQGSVIDLARDTFNYFHYYYVCRPDQISTQTQLGRDYIQYMADSLGTLGRSITPTLKGDDFSIKSMISSIYRELLCSRHFITFCCGSIHCSPEFMLSKIETFYSQLDYMNLTKFYERQSAYFDCDFACDADFELFYDDFPGAPEILLDNYLYKQFDAKTFEISRNLIKHKVQNEMNNLFNDM